MIYIFNPFISIGGFDLLEEIDIYLEKYELRYIDENDSTSWKRYDYNGLSIYTEDDKIVSINCTSELLFNGQNIIGMNIDHFIQINELEFSSEVESFEMSGGIQDVYEFDSLGLQIWASEGSIVTAVASPFFDAEIDEYVKL